MKRWGVLAGVLLLFAAQWAVPFAQVVREEAIRREGMVWRFALQPVDPYDVMRGRYLEALAMSRQTLPYTLVVDHAVVAEKKAWPRRSIIVLVSAASVLLVLALVLFVAEGLKLHHSDDRQ